VIAVLQQNYHNIAALKPFAEREARLRWLGMVADAMYQPRWAAEQDRLVHHEVAFAVFQKSEPVEMPVGIVFWRQRDFTEAIHTGPEVLQDNTSTELLRLTAN
jgi:hypothetical protein